MFGLRSYLRIWATLIRLGLARELAFRVNFLVKVIVELLWLGIALVFYDVVLTHTGSGVVAGWTRAEYLFFVGCYFALEGFVETLFLSNCGAFANLVQSGDLDFMLLLPVDEQFLVSLRNVEWTKVPNILVGLGVMGYALVLLQWQFDPGRLALFAMLFTCGVALAYSFLILLMSSAVWTVRNHSLIELWWLITMLWRNPREIFDHGWTMWVGRIFTYGLPVMLIVNVPAGVLVDRALNPFLILYLVAASAILLWASRRVFRFSLRHYRSASS